MKYFKIGNKIYEENGLANDGDLLLLGAMPKEAFLRRILNCYGIDLYYNLEDKQIIIEDLENNCILENKADSPLWNNDDTNIKLEFDEEHFFNINIKRKTGLDISLKFDLVNSIDWLKCDRKEHANNKLNYINDALIEFKYSKYGNLAFKNNKTGYSFKYNTEDLNTNQTKQVSFYITSLTDQNSINYSLNNGELSTIYYNQQELYSNPTNSNSRKKDYLIPFDECTNLFSNDLKPLTEVINSDLIDLEQLAPISRIQYLKDLKNNLSNKMKNIFKQIRTAFSDIRKIKKQLDNIDEEIMSSLTPSIEKSGEQGKGMFKK